ncbi:type IV pilin-like G/H family protein [Aerosakkonemataceae cyanobacterium BLCC-F50]|uniref:Type IV pilin-like G/H family protein n=1 Tax=Floridaenema flaviceps BLCC-F50 TaxID=3153642 RepID=A0ABV4XYR7_9CYAN
MKISQNKFWHRLKWANENQGLTLYELLVVLVIIEILVVIAVPTFWRFANRAKEVEAINKIRYLNTMQQGYYMENLLFANTNTELNSYLLEESENYSYRIIVLPNVPIAIHAAISKKSDVRHYGGVVYLKSGQPVTCGPLPVSKQPTVREVLILYYTHCP